MEPNEPMEVLEPISVKTAETLVSLVPEMHKLELKVLRHTYTCKNPCCGRSYILYDNLGHWQCKCHYGHLESGKWSCCGDLAVNRTQGCLACDHWSTPRAPLTLEHTVARALCDYLWRSGVKMNNEAMRTSSDGLDMIIKRCKPIPYQ
jgi:hypothetical protein